MNGVELIAKERQRQIEKERWTAKHDDEHKFGELSLAGACYALCATSQTAKNQHGREMPRMWPWNKEWWKPSDIAIVNLVKAGALIAAEIDRLQRLASR